jgi:carboxyl-terminal processing protease
MSRPGGQAGTLVPLALVEATRQLRREDLEQFKVLRAPVIGLAVFAVLCVGFLVGFAYANTGGVEQQNMLSKLRSELAGNKVSGGRLVDKALETLRDDYFVEVTPELQQKLIYAAVHGMLSVLREAPYKDDFTLFYDPDLYKELQTETTGDYAGVGILMTTTPDGQYPEVVNVFEGSGARDTGMAQGDIILKIDEEDAYQMPLPQVAAKIKGAPGSKVRLLIYRPSDESTSTYDVERRDVHYSSITKSELRSGNVGYIRISNFAEDTGPDFRTAMDDLSAKGMKSLIIDLRDNPGGLVEAAADVANCFVKEGLIVEVETRSKFEIQKPLMADPTARKYEMPILLMVNNYSASASEILTSVLRDYDLAKVIGEQTFGKGVVQAVLPLETERIEVKDPKGGTHLEAVPVNALAVVIGKYFTPKRVEIHGKGLAPDFFYDYQNFLQDDATLKGYQDQLEKMQAEQGTLRTKATGYIRSNDLGLSKAEQLAAAMQSGKQLPAMPKIEPKEAAKTRLGIPLPPEKLDKSEDAGGAANDGADSHGDK